MPNRILRDWTDSYAVNELDAHEERFFIRLIMKVDDFGRFHADTRLLKANLFPLLPEIRDTDISRWLAACEKAGMVRCYGDVKGRQFLEIQNFRQRSRQSESKFPAPPVGRSPESPKIGERRADDGQLTANGLSTVCQAAGGGQAGGGQLRTYSETETETETERRRREISPSTAKLDELESLVRARCLGPENLDQNTERRVLTVVGNLNAIVQDVGEVRDFLDSRKKPPKLSYFLEDFRNWRVEREEAGPAGGSDFMSKMWGLGKLKSRTA